MTTANGLATQELTDAPNGPGALLALAQSVDARYGLTVADWTALLLVTTPFVGMEVFVTSLGDVARYNGTKWLAPDFDISKAVDESVTSSAALQDDNDLVYNVPAAGTYKFRLELLGSGGNAAGDIKLAMVFPAGTCHFGGIGLITSIASGSTGSGEFLARPAATSGSTVNQYGLSTTPTAMLLFGTLIASAAGPLRLQWAQRVSNATASKLLIGSSMTVRNIA